MEITNLTANNHDFSPDSGFPSTGFVGAHFTINLNKDVSPDTFDWSSNRDWVTVDQTGEVSIKEKPAGGSNEVNITATPKAGGDPLIYSFRLDSWFVNAGSSKYNAADAKKYCEKINYSLPATKTVTNATVDGAGTRETGSLWGEWGDVSAFSWPTTDFTYWMNDTGDEGYHYLVWMTTGGLYNDANYGKDQGSIHVMCSTPLPLVPRITSLTANTHDFSPDSGFPSTGFAGAHFTINLNKDVSPDTFDWSSNRDWVTVDQTGEVSIKEKPAGGSNEVNITATPKAGGDPLIYSFRLDSWFVNAGSSKYNAADAKKYCEKINYSLPATKTVTNATVDGAGTRETGSLWGEWGDVSAFSWPTTDFTYWMNDTGDEGYHYLVWMTTGGLYNDANYGKDQGSIHVMCSTPLLPVPNRMSK